MLDAFVGKAVRTYLPIMTGLTGEEKENIAREVGRLTAWAVDIDTEVLDSFPFLALTAICDKCANWASMALVLVYLELVHTATPLDYTTYEGLATIAAHRS